MYHLTRIVIFFAASLCSYLSANAAELIQCDNMMANKEAPRELQQFAFLLGQHDVSLHAWTGDKWSPARPINAHWRGW